MTVDTAPDRTVHYAPILSMLVARPGLDEPVGAIEYSSAHHCPALGGN